MKLSLIIMMLFLSTFSQQVDTLTFQITHTGIDSISNDCENYDTEAMIATDTYISVEFDVDGFVLVSKTEGEGILEESYIDSVNIVESNSSLGTYNKARFHHSYYGYPDSNVVFANTFSLSFSSETFSGGINYNTNENIQLTMGRLKDQEFVAGEGFSIPVLDEDGLTKGYKTCFVTGTARLVNHTSHQAALLPVKPRNVMVFVNENAKAFDLLGRRTGIRNLKKVRW